MESLAMELHEWYRKSSPNSKLGGKPYNELTEENKEKNRAAVRGVPYKLASIGYGFELQSSTEPIFTGGTIPDEEAEILARLEHDRWMVAAIDDGYVYGEKRDDFSFPKKHPDLVPWDDIDQKNIFKLYPEYIASRLGPGPLKNTVDIEMAKRIPEIMNSANYRVYKL